MGTLWVILCSVPWGCGKTTTATALLKGHTVCTLNAADAEFLSKDIPPDCDAVLVDDLQHLLEPERREALYNLIPCRSPICISSCSAAGWFPAG